MGERLSSKVLNDQLAQKVREVVGPFDDAFSIAHLFNPKAEVMGRSALAIVPLPGWREFLQSLDEEQRVRLGRTIITAWRGGYRTIGSIRRATTSELMMKPQIGISTARFLKTAFEPQPLPLFDRSNLL